MLEWMYLPLGKHFWLIYHTLWLHFTDHGSRCRPAAVTHQLKCTTLAVHVILQVHRNVWEWLCIASMCILLYVLFYDCNDIDDKTLWLQLAPAPQLVPSRG